MQISAKKDPIESLLVPFQLKNKWKLRNLWNAQNDAVENAQICVFMSA